MGKKNKKKTCARGVAKKKIHAKKVKKKSLCRSLPGLVVMAMVQGKMVLGSRLDTESYNLYIALFDL